ncbi:uncharacterized protein LOC121395381 isoform X1 [Xenopus laevis]|uniref:Uncharacterized protein LOC121395381 isoform X1 n=1 Tax=Xenopus laevis TaxID=8355 RepID=A0A8J1L6Y9_XENLA|nr:uncharacterized protein LOC121395381 isoform X1 [Xenopus laevis]
MEAESTPNQSRARHPGPFPRGGGNSRPRGTGGHSYFQTSRHRSQPQWSGEYDQWEDDDSCYFIEEYNYEDDCEFFPASSHGHRQRRPVKGMWQEDIGYGNNRVPSFYFRNREEEESWIQWRKEREQKGEEEAGPSRRQEGRERASSSTEGQSSQNGDRTKVPTRKTTMARDPLLEELCERAVSEKTLSSYKKARKRWQIFCRSGKSNQGTKDLVSFLMVLYREGKSRAGASNALAAISHFSIVKGRADITHDPLVRKIMKGWARVEGPRVDKREPIIECRLKMIMNSLEEVCSDQFECILFRAAFALAFGGAFRISELVPPSKKVTDKGLMYSQVLLQDRKLLVYISRSKTDQLGKGRWFSIEKTSRITCPVKALQDYIGMRPAGGHLLLIHRDLSPMSAFQFRQVLKKAVIANGWDPKKFGSHSFRIGAATEAAMRGETEDRIKGIGRWKSKAYKKYIRPINVTQ